MQPREFLETVVRPNVDDFHTHFADPRCAYNAINAVDALAAHLYVWATVHAPTAIATSSKDDCAYRAELAIRNPSFRLLRDIAKVQKHVHLTRGKPSISRAAQVTSRLIGYGQGAWGEGRYGGGQQIVVDLDDGSISYAENIVDNALSFLEDEMSRLDTHKQ